MLCPAVFIYGILTLAAPLLHSGCGQVGLSADAGSSPAVLPPKRKSRQPFEPAASYTSWTPEKNKSAGLAPQLAKIVDFHFRSPAPLFLWLENNRPTSERCAWAHMALGLEGPLDRLYAPIRPQ